MSPPVACERTGCHSLADHRIGDRWLCGSHFNASVTRYTYEDPMAVTVRESLITTISLIRFRTLPQESLIKIELNHFPELSKAEIEHAIDLLVADRTLVRNDGNLFLPYRPKEDIDPAYLAKADAYRLAHKPTRWERIKGWLGLLWDRIWLQVAFLIATSLFALGLAASEGRWLTVIASGYCPCALCCDTRTERTANATDTNARPYGIAASPDIRLGSRCWIPSGAGYLDVSRPADRWFDIDDRGGALRTEWRRSGITRLDLRYRSHVYAKAFGRKLMMVWVVL
jgi:3D (Asp-Asp-Asp) domain-containing protein